MMKYWYDQRYKCCEACHHFRDSLIQGRKACGEYAMPFSEYKGIVDDVCEKYKTEQQWQEEQIRDEMLKKQARRKKK